jgi:hypothetical protein
MYNPLFIEAKSLTLLLIELALKRGKLDEVSKSAMETVRIRHNWGSVVSRYLPIYEGLLDK